MDGVGNVRDMGDMEFTYPATDEEFYFAYGEN